MVVVCDGDMMLSSEDSMACGIKSYGLPNRSGGIKTHNVKELRETVRNEAPFDRKAPLCKYPPLNTRDSDFLDKSPVYRHWRHCPICRTFPLNPQNSEFLDSKYANGNHVDGYNPDCPLCNGALSQKPPEIPEW